MKNLKKKESSSQTARLQIWINLCIAHRTLLEKIARGQKNNNNLVYDFMIQCNKQVCTITYDFSSAVNLEVNSRQIQIIVGSVVN